MVKKNVIKLRMESERLILRPWTMDDVDRLSVICNDLDISRFTRNNPYPYTRDDAVKFVERIQNEIEQRIKYGFAIELKEENTAIGYICLYLETKEPILEKGIAEMGYWIGKDYRSKAYAFEASRALMHWGFEKLELTKIFAHCLECNPASFRIMEKLGMQREGHFSKHLLLDGNYEDTLHYGILKEEFVPDDPTSTH